MGSGELPVRWRASDGSPGACLEEQDLHQGSSETVAQQDLSHTEEMWLSH